MFVDGLKLISSAVLCTILLVIDAGSCSTDDQQKASDDLRKDVSELGIEVIEHISTAAGD